MLPANGNCGPSQHSNMLSHARGRLCSLKPYGRTLSKWSSTIITALVSTLLCMHLLPKGLLPTSFASIKLSITHKMDVQWHCVESRFQSSVHGWPFVSV